MAFTLEIQNKDGVVLGAARGEERVELAYAPVYEEGDKIILRTTDPGCFAMLKLDDAMGEAFVYVNTEELVYEIPFNEKRISYSPRAFVLDRHVLSVRKATEDEISIRKNLALNVYDQHGDPGLFPHAHANVETRGEAVFAARNAIDGCCCNLGHGAWPYESWGINRRDDAEIILEFGREVEIDSMVLVTRADFPHDNYWMEATFTFSDGTTLTHSMTKSIVPHLITLPEKKKVTWIKLNQLIKDPGQPSPFPALSQWEVYGKEA